MSRIAAKAMVLLMPVLGFGLAPALAQQSFENLDRVDSIVAMTVGANIGQPGGAVAPVDRRLKLAGCPQMPEVSGPVFGAAMVECKPLGWRIRVPLVPGGGYEGAGALPSRAAYGRAVPAARKEILIKRGEPVQLVAGGASFTVSRLMIADEDGAAGDIISVREDRKSDPVLAQVMESGIVRAPGFKDF